MAEKTNIAFQTQFHIMHEPFTASIGISEKGMCMGAEWNNELQHTLCLSDLISGLSITLPAFLDLQIRLQSIKIIYQADGRILYLNMMMKNGRGLQLAANLSRQMYSCRMNTTYTFHFMELPFVGNYFQASEGFTLSYVQATYGKKDGIEFAYELAVNLLGFIKTFGELSQAEPSEALAVYETENTPVKDAGVSTIKWMELKKRIGPVYLSRIAAQFKESQIMILLDASFTISIITLSFIELYIAVDIAKGFSFTYGLKGLLITVQKPPLYISGGLYIAEPGRLYNGEVEVRYEKFSFLALGSYGITEDKKTSVFIYLMLDYAFGGPPCFYITGLVAGFGLNRKLNLPTLKHVEEFPFVAAAMGNSKTLKPKSDPASVLSELSDYVEPQDGVDFITAGIKFTSFGMVESILVASVEFGARTEISLLGLSELTLPPKARDPIVYGCLALRAVFAPDDGILQIEGALTNDAYLFTKDCHLRGGFAFYSWFKGEHSGDFVISIGGYHHNYHRPAHYPAVERINISWDIAKGLTLKGEAYCALTPNCIMAGGKLDLDYVNGKLKAWCHAVADFLIEWKPFHYDIEIGVSVGASYRIDFCFIHKTFKVELGAHLHLWGPEFAGLVKIKWYIISFSIHFGNSSTKLPNRLSWTEFAQGFLPDYSGGITGSSMHHEILTRFLIIRGKMNERKIFFPGKHQQVPVYDLNATDFQLTVESALPCAKIFLKDTLCYQDKNTYGILPMGVKNLQTVLAVKVVRVNSVHNSLQTCPVNLKQELFTQHIPGALWRTYQPAMGDEMIKDAHMGITLYSTIHQGSVLPGNDSWYSLMQLQKNEEYLNPLHARWNVIVEPEKTDKNMPVNEIIKTLKKSIRREQWLSQLTSYHVRCEREIDIDNFADNLQKLMLCPLVIYRIGADKEII